MKLKLGLHFYNFDIFFSNLSFRPQHTQHNEQQKLITTGEQSRMKNHT